MKKKGIIKLGDKKLSELNIYNLIDIAIIEGICSSLEIWEFPHILYFSNMTILDTIVLQFHQKKKNEAYFGNTVVFSYNFKNFFFQWYLENNPNAKEIKNIGIETIKYLIEKKYDLPLY